PITTTIMESPRIKRRAEFVAIRGEKSSGGQLKKHGPSRQPVEHAVICPGERKSPGVSAAQADRRSPEGYFREGIVVSVAANHARQFCTHPRCGSDAMPRKSKGEMHAIDLS